MKRRDFLMSVGTAIASVAFPRIALAQQAAKLPVIGYLSVNNDVTYRATAAFADYQRGLADGGFVEGRNVAIEWRWANGDNDKTLTFMNDLIQRRVSVLSLHGIWSGNASGELLRALAASGIPSVSGFPRDPRKDGLLDNLSRPSGNLTGVNQQTQELEGKRLSLLHDVVPGAKAIGYLARRSTTETQALLPTAGLIQDVQKAAQGLGLRLVVLYADSVAEIETAFESLKANPVDALIIGANSFFNANRQQIARLVTAARIPAIGEWREFAADGALLSYGTSLGATQYQIAEYVAAILRGAKITDLPVLQNSTYELVINVATAKALGVTIPPLTFAQATEVLQ